MNQEMLALIIAVLTGVWVFGGVFLSFSLLKKVLGLLLKKLFRRTHPIDAS